MKKYLVSIIFILVAISLVALSFLVVGCSNGNDGKLTLTTNSDEARELYYKGCNYLDNLRRGEAAKYFTKALELDSTFALARLQLSLSKSSVNSLVDNIDRIKQDVANASEGEKLVVAATDAGFNSRPKEQKKYLEELIALHPRDERCLMMLGAYYYNYEEYQKAIDVYKRIIAENDKFAPVYNMIGYSYRNLDNYAEAESYLKKYIELIPNDPNPYDSYGELLLKMGKFEESLESYKKAISIDPYFVYSYLGLATNNNLLGNHIEARNQLKKMLEIAKSPTQKREAAFGMAVSYVDEGNLGMGLKLLEKRIEISKSTGNLLDHYGDMQTYGLLALQDDQLDLSRETLEQAFKLIDGSDQTDAIKDQVERMKVYFASLLALKVDDVKTAKEKANEYNELVNKVQNSLQKRNVHELLGQIALVEKDYATADQELRLANQANPLNLYRLGVANKGLGENDKALSFFKKAAYANMINSLNYALVRKKALAQIAELEPVT